MGDGQGTRLMRTPKEGERILAPTRRPDGSLRKPIRIRAGYTPQDEVAIYQSKGSLMRKAAEVIVPPGYDLSMDAKIKTKSEKRNERKKEKKLQEDQSKKNCLEERSIDWHISTCLQATLVTSDKGKDLDLEEAAERITEGASVAVRHRLDSVESVMEGINKLSVSPLAEKLEPSNAEGCSGADIDKRIRALKKKIRLAEGQLKGEVRIEKTSKIEGWHEELKLLEFKRTSYV